jgi:hypothetical protein
MQMKSNVRGSQQIDNKQTAEIARLQIGEDPEQVRVLVTNLSEAENLLPLFLDYQKEGKQVNVKTPQGNRRM